MNTIWEEFKSGGFMNWFILLFGLLGLVAAVVALLLTALRSRSAFAIGVASAFVGAWIACLGVLGVWLGHRMLDAALEGGAVGPSQAMRVRRAGFSEAKSCAKFGAVFGSIPLFAGLIAIGVSFSRRRAEADAAASAAAPRPPAGHPSGGSAPSDHPGVPDASWFSGPAAPPPPSAASPLIVAGVAALPFVGLFILLRAPLPGPDLAPDDPTWELLSAKDTLDSGDLDGGCAELEKAVTGGAFAAGVPADTSKLPDFDALASRCVDHQIKEALSEPALERIAPLTDIKRSKLPKTDEQQKRIDQAISEARPSAAALAPVEAGAAAADAPPPNEPSLKGSSTVGGLSVSGGLPPDVIQRVIHRHGTALRECYNAGLARNPNLAGTVRAKIVIGRDGAVSVASDAGSDMPDPQVTKCVLVVFRRMTFPETGGDIVTVVSPVRFAQNQ